MESQPEVRVRRARREDAEAIIALEQLFPGDRMSDRAIRRLLGVPSAAAWVALRQGWTCGALVMTTRRGSTIARIYSLVVHPEARGHGLGIRLVHAAQTEARKRGCSTMSLEVRADNQAARALYERLGYHLHACLPDYYEDGETGLRLRRTF